MSLLIVLGNLFRRSSAAGTSSMELYFLYELYGFVSEIEPELKSL
jgi:hypothetical protein